MTLGVDLKHPAGPAAANRHARRRAADHLGPGCVAQFERAAGQGDPPGAGEDGRVKLDRVGRRVRIRLGDRLAEVGLASDGRVGRVVHDERGEQPAFLQRQHRRPQPPPLPWLARDRSPPAPPRVPCFDATHGSLAPSLLNNEW